MSLSLLYAVPQAAADTVVAVAARDSLGLAVDLAILLMALAVALLALLFARVLFRVDRSVRDVRRRVDQSLGPVSDRARAISDNVEFITDALRTDVERLDASIKALSARLSQASDRMEERVEEFNALMELVQSEAEHIFLDTAATVRGVREGARTMATRDGAAEERPRPPLVVKDPVQTGSVPRDADGEEPDTPASKPQIDPSAAAENH